jgi:hypothetical protein
MLYCSNKQNVAFYLGNATHDPIFRDTKQNSTNLCLIRIHTKYYPVTRCTIDSAPHFSYHILKKKFRLTRKATIALFDFTGYRFKNQNSSGGQCKYLSHQHASRSASPVEVSVSSIPVVFSITVNDRMGKVSEIRQKGL